MNRERLAWALLFSVPVGIGIVGFAAHVINRGVFEPTAIAAGVATTLVIFTIFLFATSVGSADQERQHGDGR